MIVPGNGTRPLFPVAALLFAASLFWAALPAASQEQPLIAVLPFEAIQASAAETATGSSLLESALADIGAWRVVGAAETEAALRAQGGGRCAEAACAAQIGAALGAQQVVLGALARVGTSLILNAKIVDVGTGRTIVADSADAAGGPGLEGACRALARRLAARLWPERFPPETTPGPAPAAEGGAGSGGTSPAGLAEESAAGTERVSGQGPEPSEPLERGGIDTWVQLSAAGGAFLGLLGNVSGSLSFLLHRSSDEAYADYEAATMDFDALWQRYTRLHGGYAASAIGSYTFWTLAAAAAPVHWGLFPEKAFELTGLGRRAYVWGTGLTVAGHVLDLLAAAQSYTVEFLYDDYQSAGTDRDRLYTRYVAGRVVYVSEQVLSYALWGAGAAGAGGAFLLRGEREPVVEGVLEKALTVAGTALLSAGGFTRTAALNARQEYAVSGGLDEQAHSRYVGWAAASCALWAAGGAALIVPVLAELPGGGRGEAGAQGEQGERPTRVSLLPAPGGLVVRVAWAGRSR